MTVLYGCISGTVLDEERLIWENEGVVTSRRLRMTQEIASADRHDAKALKDSGILVRRQAINAGSTRSIGM
jgi:hypothetical protein